MSLIIVWPKIGQSGGTRTHINILKVWAFIAHAQLKYFNKMVRNHFALS